MKNVKEYLIEKLDAELPAFISVFEALPADKLDWKPDPKSKTAKELASQMAQETGQIAEIITTGKIDFNASTFKTYSTSAEMVTAFKEGVEKAKTQLSTMNDSDWDADATLTMNGQNPWTTKRGEMAWGFLFDLIHHRGQLATYIRPMGGKVPSIYGPSADSQ